MKTQEEVLEIVSELRAKETPWREIGKIFDIYHATLYNYVKYGVEPRNNEDRQKLGLVPYVYVKGRWCGYRYCDNVFIPVRENHKFCSDDCCYKEYNEIRRGGRLAQ